MKWKVSEKLKSKGQKVKVDEIISVLLKNRGLITKKQKDEFFSPKHPNKLSLREVDIKTPEVKKAINRIKKAKKNKEKVIVYGDYDADGLTSAAILLRFFRSLDAEAD